MNTFHAPDRDTWLLLIATIIILVLSILRTSVADPGNQILSRCHPEWVAYWVSGGGILFDQERFGHAGHMYTDGLWRADLDKVKPIHYWFWRHYNSRYIDPATNWYAWKEPGWDPMSGYVEGFETKPFPRGKIYLREIHHLSQDPALRRYKGPSRPVQRYREVWRLVPGSCAAGACRREKVLVPIP